MISKIEALKGTIKLLQDSKYDYQWTTQCRCNIGTLLRAVNPGIEANNLWDFGKDNVEYPSTKIYGSIIPNGGQIITSAYTFPKLYSIGFTPQELYDFEHLLNLEIAKEGDCVIDNKAIIIPCRRGDRKEVIKYLKGWIHKLEKEKVNTYIERSIEKRKISVPKELLYEPMDAHVEHKSGIKI